jgi:hypothetical protein
MRCSAPFARAARKACAAQRIVSGILNSLMGTNEALNSRKKKLQKATLKRRDVLGHMMRQLVRITHIAPPHHPARHAGQ